MSENIKNYNGFIGIVKPGCDDVEFHPFDYSTDEKSIENAFIKIIDYVTKENEDDNPGKIANAGYLPAPFSDFTMFMNYDQFDPNIKYNLGLFGTPIFGQVAFLMVDKNSENGTVLPIPENKKKVLSDAIKHFKDFEKSAGIYDSMCKTDKNKFLEEFIKEKNSILEESTKNIKGDNYDDLQEAKKELEKTLNNMNNLKFLKDKYP